MKNFSLKKVALFVLLFTICTLQSQKLSKNKQALVQSIEKHQNALIEISDKIWQVAETAFEETESSKILSDYAEKQGFTIRLSRPACRFVCPGGKTQTSTVAP